MSKLTCENICNALFSSSSSSDDPIYYNATASSAPGYSPAFKYSTNDTKNEFAKLNNACINGNTALAPLGRCTDPHTYYNNIVSLNHDASRKKGENAAITYKVTSKVISELKDKFPELNGSVDANISLENYTQCSMNGPQSNEEYNKHNTQYRTQYRTQHHDSPILFV